MKTKLTALALLTGVGLILSGCAGGASTTTTTTTQTDRTHSSMYAR